MKRLAFLFGFITVAALFTVAFTPLYGADWQFAIDVAGTKSKTFLWIPPNCKQVRGVILGQQVILENKVLEDPVIREVATQENLAIALICPGCVGYFQTKEAEEMLQGILNDLARESGYEEIAQAPLLTVGHSGNGIFAWNVAYVNPARMIGVVGLHCMSSQPPVLYPKATMDGVPILGISGEYESWGNPRLSLDNHWRWLRGGLLEFRAHLERAFMSEIVDPGGCHFSFNEPMAKYVALFIRKAAHYRLPETKPGTEQAAAGQAVALREIPVESGWLTDLTLMTPSQHPPAPYAKYEGDPSLAFWQFDEEMARANEAYRADARGKLDQRVTFVQDGKQVPAEWIETLKFEPIGDGLTVKVSADFLTETPAGVAGAGKPLGHAKGPISFSLIGGWRGGGEQIGLDTFRIRPGHLGTTDNLMILATQPGDDKYAWAEQPCQIKYPKKNVTGKPQKIAFAPIPDQAAGAKELKLEATADSGLPVEYYVLRGPAEIDGQTLKFTKLPPRVHTRVKVTVVAYQWGRTLEPQVQSAESVEQTFLIAPDSGETR